MVGLYVDPPAPATYFNWKRKFDGLLPTEMRRLKQLEDENGKLKRFGRRLVSRQGDAAGRHPPKALRPVRQRKLVDEMRGEWDVSIRGLSGFQVDTSTYHYKSRRPGQAGLEQRIKEICQTRCAMAIGAFTFCCGARAAPQSEQDTTHLSRIRPAIAQQDAQARVG